MVDEGADVPTAIASAVRVDGANSGSTEDPISGVVLGSVLDRR
jgi:hypothetical protein